MRHSLYLLPTLLLASCQQEFDFDYHTIESQYVVEGTLHAEGCTVRISGLRSMENHISDLETTNATVVITSSDSTQETLRHTGNGTYRSTTFCGKPGKKYQLDVTVGDRHFQSTSTMLSAPTINRLRFIRQRLLGTQTLFADLRLQDVQGETNYYFMHIYRNSLGYRWAVMRDNTNPGKELQQLFNCNTLDDSDGLQEGDYIYLEVRSIDKRAYDYLYSVQQMAETSSNPVENFTGGCLGYFSAYSRVTYDCIFHTDDVEDK